MLSAAFVVFLASVGLLVVRNVKYGVLLLSAEGFALSIMVWLSGRLTMGLVAIGLATLVVKAIIIPRIMRNVVGGWPIEYRRDGSLPIWAYASGVALLLTVTHVIKVLTPTGIILHPALFFYGLASVYLGLLQIVSRRHVLSQVGSLIAVENAFVILAASVAEHLPMFMEFGMLVDMFMAAIIMLWMSQLVHGHFKTTDVTAMRFLRR